MQSDARNTHISSFTSGSFELRYGGTASAFTSLSVGDSYLNLQLDVDWTPPEQVWGRVIIWVDDVDAMHATAVAAGHVPHGVSNRPR